MVRSHYYAWSAAGWAACCAVACWALWAQSADRFARNSLGMELVRIEPGSFETGVDSTPFPKELTAVPKGTVYDRPAEGDYDETPVHKVTIGKPYWIGVTEVTAAVYRQFRPDYKGDTYYAPYANGVSWHDATAFCEWLSKREGKTYRP